MPIALEKEDHQRDADFKKVDNYLADAMAET